jgi:hypothetical protein
MIINGIYLIMLSGTQEEDKELAGTWMWLWPQQGTVLPKYEVLIVVSTGCFRRNSKYFRRW